MAVAVAKDATFLWEGMDKKGKKIKGQMLAPGEALVAAQLRRQGITVTKVRKQSALFAGVQRITEKDIALFTRQLATMMKAGVPLLQAFDIVGKGNANRSVQKLLSEVKADIEKGSSMYQAFSKQPKYFDNLFCNLVNAGEQAGILDDVLDRLASYKEKILKLKGKIKSALFYPAAVLTVAFVVTAVIMIFVIPAFKELFSSFGADLPAPTLMVIAMSDFFVKWWWAIFGILIGGTVAFSKALRRSKPMQAFVDRWVLRLPIIGVVLEKATIARWSRTLSTMFAAGVPLVDALDSVAGASGNYVYEEATYRIKGDVATGTALTTAMQSTGKFPNMVMQMTAIGEESGSLDSMLSKVADFYEQEVDDAVDALSSLLEPLIMVVLGVLIGGMVIAMYLPIFNMGKAVG